MRPSFWRPFGAVLFALAILSSFGPISAQAANSCQKFVGRWTWNGGATTVDVKPDGTADIGCALCDKNLRWTCEGNVFKLSCCVVGVDLTLAPDGKQMSGGRGTSVRLTAPTTAPPSSAANPGASNSGAGPGRGSVAGSWRYTQHCTLSGNWTGEINLKGPPQHITGSVAIDQANPLTADSIIDGHVTENDVVLTRRFSNPFGTFTQTWTAKLSDSEKFAKMSGTISYSMESCSFTATSSSAAARRPVQSASAPNAGSAAPRLIGTTPDEAEKLLKAPAADLSRGVYKLDQEYDFNVLDDVYYDATTQQISLIGHRDERFKGPRIPYLQHLATLLEVTKPEFTLNMTPESLRQIDAFFKTTLSTQQVDKMAKQLGAVVDQNGNITAVGRYMLPALGLYPAPNNTPAGYLGVTTTSFVSPKSKYAKIETVAANSPAAQLGLRPGDLIFAMNGAWTYSPDELNHLTRFNGAGATVGLAYLRGDNLFNVTVTLAADPNSDPWAGLNAYDVLIALYRDTGFQERAIVIDAMRKLKNDPKPPAIEHYYGLTDALGIGQEARQFAANNWNRVDKGQAIAYGRLFSERLDQLFGLPGNPSAAAFNANLANGKNAGVAQQAALDQFDRANVPQVAGLLERFFKRPEGVQIPPELVETIYHVRPEMTPDFLGVPPNSLLARAMFDGDYLMKRLNNRPDLKAKIPSYQTEFEFKRNNPQFRRKESTTRQWISVAKMDAAQSTVGDTLELRGVQMRINIREHSEVNGSELPNVPGGYEELLTSLYDELSQEYPTLHELSETAKLSAAAAWLRSKNRSLRLPKDGAVQWQAPAKVPGLLYVYYSTDSDGPKITKVAMGGVNLEPFIWARPQLSNDSSVVDLRGTAAGGPMPQGAPLIPIDSSIVDLRTANGGALIRPPNSNPTTGWTTSPGPQDGQSVSIVINQIASLSAAEAEKALARRAAVVSNADVLKDAPNDTASQAQKKKQQVVEVAVVAAKKVGSELVCPPQLPKRYFAPLRYGHPDATTCWPADVVPCQSPNKVWSCPAGKSCGDPEAGANGQLADLARKCR